MGRFLITGATSGIGADVAERLHGRGDDLVLVARDASRGETLEQRYPGSEVRIADLDDPASVAGALGQLPALDGVVASAGVCKIGPVVEASLDTWRHTLDVNVLSVVETVRACLPGLRQARGTIVLLNSMSGIRVAENFGVYAASKYALRAYADAVRQEEAAHGVRVTGIHPGRVSTRMQADIHRQEQREYDPQVWIDVATAGQAVMSALDLPRDAVLPELLLAPMPPVRRHQG